MKDEDGPTTTASYVSSVVVMGSWTAETDHTQIRRHEDMP